MEVKLLQATAQKTRSLDPRTKLLLLFLINTTVFHGGTWYLTLPFLVIPFFLFIYSEQTKPGMMYAFTIIIGYFFHLCADYLSGKGGFVTTIFAMVAYTINRMLPCLAMGYYLISSTSISEFIASMERLRIPRSIIIPFSVMFRFFPTIAEEARSISDAMRMRGVSFGTSTFLRDPFSMIEYRLIPLLISTVKIGEELAAASLTRGLGNPQKRTNICRIGFGPVDYILILFTSAALLHYVYDIYLKKGFH
jgi:energy-coupling factor transporter transmembrane protein EcfT